MLNKVKSIAVRTRVGKWLRAMKHIAKVAQQESYYPELPRKSYGQRVLDLLRWRQKWREVHRFYNAYGQDCVGADMDAYMDYFTSYMGSRDRLNAVDKLWNMTCLFEDKFLFYRTMKSLGAPTPEVFAFIHYGNIYDATMNPLERDALEQQKDFFLKNAYGICGNLVKHIEGYAQLVKLLEEIPQDGAYVLQERIRQCDEENRLYPNAVNTIRLVTIRKRGGEPRLLAKMQRIGTSKSNNVDNWAAGGIAVGIEGNGFLKRWGLYKYMYGRKTDCHPDSGVRFSDFKVPMLEEAIALVLNLHRYFYNIHSIGWDVALTPEGPVVVEGNENWDMGLAQACDRPLRKEFMDSID